MGIDPGVSRLGGEIVSHNTTDARQPKMVRLDGAEVSASGLQIGTFPVQVKAKTNFSIMIKLPVESTVE